MSKLFNKMYIVSGIAGDGDAPLSNYRFQSRAMLNKMATAPMNAYCDVVVEVDTTGKSVYYHKYSCDNYWTTGSDIKLAEANALRPLVMYQGKWHYVDGINPLTDQLHTVLKERGYQHKLGWAHGMYPPGVEPSPVLKCMSKLYSYLYYNTFRIEGLVELRVEYVDTTDHIIIYHLPEDYWKRHIPKIGEAYIANNTLYMELCGIKFDLGNKADADVVASFLELARLGKITQTDEHSFAAFLELVRRGKITQKDDPGFFEPLSKRFTDMVDTYRSDIIAQK